MQPQPLQLPLADIRQKIQSARSILIVLPQQQTVDAVAAGLALYLCLEQNFSADSAESEKSIKIVSPLDMTVAYQRLYGVGSIGKNLGSKNLVISLNVAHDAIEKVLSTNDNNKFNLIIESKPGVRRIAQEDIEVSYQGVDADLVITVGLTSAEQAGNLLSQEKNLFADRDTIVISNQVNTIPFGTINLQDVDASSLSEMIAKVLRFLKYSVDPDVATNLLAGIEAATNSFSTKTTADTFAAVSWCMRMGGKRNHLVGMGTIPPVIPSAPRFGAPFEPSMPFPPVSQKSEEQVARNFEPIPPSPFQPIPPVSEQAGEEVSEDITPQQDWFEPKIFKTPPQGSGVSKA